MKVLNTTKAIILCSLAILLSSNYSFATNGHNRRQVSTFDVISSNIQVNAGTTKSLNLSNSTYIKKLIISAQGTPRSGATMQVVVNGDIKGTIHVPRHDPSYFVTVNDTTKSIEFVSLSGTINISAVKIIGSTHSSHSRSRWKPGQRYSKGLYGHNAGTLAQDIALTAIDLVNEFTKYSSYKELGDVLLPIKKSAAVVYATSYGAGDYSVKMRSTLMQMSKQLHLANHFINRNFEKSAIFDLALELLTLKERLDSIIN